jgi:hypothetical protein
MADAAHALDEILMCAGQVCIHGFCPFRTFSFF